MIHIQKDKKEFKMRKIACLLVILFLLSMTACTPKPDVKEDETNTGTVSPEVTATEPGEENGDYVIKLSGDLFDSERQIDIEKLFADEEKAFTGVYSVINNWPTKKFYAASGVKLEAILDEAGVGDFAQITIVASDGYRMSFTREQVLAERFCYPGILEDDESGFEPVPMIIATGFAEGSDNVADISQTAPALIFGQEFIGEHNSPAFVEQISEIIVSAKDPGSWDVAYAFPQAGNIAAGESVKLQHDSIGRVKLYYTTDGTEPTKFSACYNPSTYQPELSVPIEINEDTVIKVLVCGYGKKDSEIAELHFSIS